MAAQAVKQRRTPGYVPLPPEPPIPQERGGAVPRQVPAPVKEISLAVFLLLIGSFMLTCGVLIVAGHVEAEKEGAGWGLIALGAITFIPGSYESWLAFSAWRGNKDYSAIPHLY